jgi:hypothetical protein
MVRPEDAGDMPPMNCPPLRERSERRPDRQLLEIQLAGLLRAGQPEAKKTNVDFSNHSGI